MNRLLSRRLRDAICAFRTGHSVRDHERVGRSRLTLLAGRIAARKRANAKRILAESEYPSFVEICSDHEEKSAQRLIDLCERATVRGERLAQAILAQHIDLDRCCLYMLRREELSHIDPIETGANGASGSIESPAVPAGELYGKLYEGLLEQFRLDLGNDELGFRRWNWHRLLHSMKLHRFQHSSWEAR